MQANKTFKLTDIMDDDDFKLTKHDIELVKAFMSGDINQWFKVGLLKEVKDFPTISRKVQITTKTLH